MTKRKAIIGPGAVEALSKGQKIEAIKIVRQESGLGLEAAKAAVDAYVASPPPLQAVEAEVSHSSAQPVIVEPKAPASMPDWSDWNETPDTTFVLTAMVDAVMEQEIELTRSEFIVLKEHLAAMRHADRNKGRW